ncbi:TIGR01459 family HAD-type hydrolase [Sabulicella glaciei]|uniref:TIGR01459 family HAD-type hydrolase n=1 Tax=Sabulicella glaciei TaxID=2984948 RepID=A0ABT3NUE0_9PROT|nr:TIGR01459 family HAD-type hydrolase [Roseococcus sp. MDT2-1-1]MCW8085777.1 TIGR01459 family HAD-type hydrolase [Roseococcus sp. MDT2-1-1]
MKIWESLEPVADRYDGFVLDLWGVVHDGRKPYAGVPECLREMRRRGKRVVFLTNAPRRSWFIANMLDGMGLERDLYDGIISSGEVTWRWLKDRTHPFFAALRGRRAFHIGPERDLSVVEDGAAEIVSSPEEADLLLNTGPDPERGPRSVEPYREDLRACFAAGLPMVCVNPDRAVMVAGERILCAGALADVYAEWGGSICEVGKPDPAVYGPVLEMLGVADRRRILCVGDTPHTDLRGAQAAGLDAFWALTGLTEDAHGSNPSPALLARVAEEEGAHPLGALRRLNW